MGPDMEGSDDMSDFDDDNDSYKDRRDDYKTDKAGGEEVNRDNVSNWQ